MTQAAINAQAYMAYSVFWLNVNVAGFCQECLINNVLPEMNDDIIFFNHSADKCGPS